MPIYNNVLAQRPSNQLAYQSTIGPVPRNEYLGALADFLAGSYSAERTQQMQGISKFLGVPAVSQTLDRLSYGEPLTTGAGGLGGTTRIRPEVLEAALTVAPLAQPVTMASLQAARAARQAALATGRTLGPAAAGMAENLLQRQGLMPGVLPSPKSLTMPSVPTVEQMKQHGRSEVVPLSQAVSFQTARNWDKFKAGKGPGDLVQGFGDKPLALRLETGEYVIYDGNHRTDLALQQGKTALPMHVIDVKSYDPAHAGRKPVPSKISDDELLSLLGAR